jgi:ribosomal protein S12 methylthiotransferase
MPHSDSIIHKNPPTVGFVSLGCPKATVDAERILTQLRAEGYVISGHYNEADLVIVNTCGFIDDAIDESLDAIGEALNENGRVIVTGCLGAKGDIVQQNHPQVLAVTGPDALGEVMAAVHQSLPPKHDPYTDLVPAGGIKLTPRHYAYLKIAEGCNQKCSFCIIPSMRGKLKSRLISEILDEAERLVSDGVKELLIVSQDTAAYGVDKKYALDFWQGRPIKTRIGELARELGRLGIWVRMHYIYPYPHVDSLVELMAEGVVLPYLDVPMQHASRDILKAMRRPADSENMLRRIQAWRETCPEITLRSTFIVGFPGETEDDFEQLLTFLKAAQLDWVGAFAYSPVEGAAANILANPVPAEIQQERLARFNEVQTVITQGKLYDLIGQETEVIIDEFDSETGFCYARSQRQAPEVDGWTLIDGLTEAQAQIGKKIRVKMTDVTDMDIWAELVE